MLSIDTVAMKKRSSAPTQLQVPVNTAAQHPIQDEQDFDLGVWENVEPDGEYPPASKLNIRLKSEEPVVKEFSLSFQAIGRRRKCLSLSSTNGGIAAFR